MRPIRVLACGIFARELECVDPELRARIEPRFLDSMLHMRPSLLDERLEEALGEEAERPTAILYGDCCPHMGELAAAPGRARTQGINCVEIAIGRERFKELRRQGAFFFMDEWLERWREVFSYELGFKDPALARGFMQESAKMLVYIDTGCAEAPMAELEAIGVYFGLPVFVERAGLGGLESALRAAMEGLEHGH